MTVRSTSRSTPQRSTLPFVIIGLAALCGGPGTAHGDDTAGVRAMMIEDIRKVAAYASADTDSSGLDEKVLAVMARVPRHEFVPERQRAHAYANSPLPIGHGQTISQPYIVALMTDLLDVEPDDKVLEVGTGSGYQAAVLGELVDRVYTIEIVEALATRARGDLAQLGYENVEVRLADGYHGWPEHAPFDAIVVTAAASHVPPPLVEQLKPGGVMAIPVGDPFTVQQLVVVTKLTDGGVRTRQVLPVRFVPLTGGH